MQSIQSIYRMEFLYFQTHRVDIYFAVVGKNSFPLKIAKDAQLPLTNQPEIF